MLRRWASTCAILLMVTVGRADAQRLREQSSDSEPAKAAPATSTGAAPNLTRVKQRILRLTNRFRRDNGRGRLRVNPALERAAQSFADYLASTDKFSHTADGKEPWERGAKFGYRYSLFAENIAMEYNSEGFTASGLARKFVQGWEKSPGHRKNMLNANVDEIGVGVARSKKTGRYYAVQDFGRPKSEAVTFQITNRSGDDLRYRLDGKEFTLRPGYTVTHERPVPPKLTFSFPKGDGKKDESHVYHPGSRDHLVVGRGSTGEYKVSEE